MGGGAGEAGEQRVGTSEGRGDGQGSLENEVQARIYTQEPLVPETEPLLKLVSPVSL